MKGMFKIVFVLAVAGGLAQCAFAEEQGEVMNKENQNGIIMNNKEGGMVATMETPTPVAQEPMNKVEPPSAVPPVVAPSVMGAPSSEEIKTAVSNYIKEQTDEGGAFDIFDSQTQTMRELSFVKFHDEVGKSGEYSFICADFMDKNYNDKLDLDFDVESAGDKFNVIGVKIHMVNDVARYTYDDKYNRVPVVPAGTEEKNNTMIDEKKEGEEEAPASYKTVPPGEEKNDMDHMNSENAHEQGGY